ncbi:uncharacterized protein STEHIDRAFT_157609 [Stereum hirsutum FP-91666 SS1]|uniref:uncharacterized protein n=1 Tax=Stereum hirsutum (strain FP-91666) TaxID=721885 RepID=UPI0004449589|nr:uncharacterized protein STEHIDRAFT_157609 [Stereum hirsutum FP-91666 SS1]EIM86094.1 hypothetical protein STEHIDRAFT_157609 [Stereum hirsutum FP-91666 SS1]
MSSNTSERLSESDRLEILEFLRDPFVASLIETHPNRLVAASSSSSSVPRGLKRLDWCDSTGTSYSDADSGGQKTQKQWETLVQAYIDSDARDGGVTCAEDIPDKIARYIDRAKKLDLDRSPEKWASEADSTAGCPSANMAAVRPPSIPGMSPKKSHEVSRMASYIDHLVSSSPCLRGVRHVVDVGAGQGYLSRALCDLGFHVLALDGSDVQTKGAERRRQWEQKGKTPASRTTGVPEKNGAASVEISGRTRTRGSLTHKTIHITPSTLYQAVTAWIQDAPYSYSDDSSSTENLNTPIPVLVVGLHACGSLTPDILRVFLSFHDSPPNTTAPPHITTWTPKAAVVVGCCYNMMNAEDFPLSKAFRAAPHASPSPSPSPSLSLTLTPSHLQLAAQTPSHWFDTPTSKTTTELSIRKVVFRALLERFLPVRDRDHSTAPETQRYSSDATRPRAEAWREEGKEKAKRLGRLPDSAYASLEIFLARACQKFDLDLEGVMSSDLLSDSKELQKWITRLEILHVLRCLAGPAIESMVVRDRLCWLRESLHLDSDPLACRESGSVEDGGGGDQSRSKGTVATASTDRDRDTNGNSQWDVRLVGLFDQALGSARNFGIVVVPIDRVGSESAEVN